jgi:hypothetical protein
VSGHLADQPQVKAGQRVKDEARQIFPYCDCHSVIVKEQADMRILPFALVALLSAPAMETSAQNLSGSVHYNVGGLMSIPSTIDIDLATGNTSVNEAKMPHEPLIYSKTRLSQDQLIQIYSMIQEVLKNGMESDACLQRRRSGNFMPSQIDAVIMLSVTVPNGSAVAPADPGCWNDSAQKLAGAIYSDAHPQKP